MNYFGIAVCIIYAAVMVVLVVAVLSFVWNLIIHHQITRLSDIGILALAFVILSIYVADMKNDDEV